MRLAPIASGSSGNCIYIGSDNTHVLIDVGISAKRIEDGLRELDIKGEDLDGIFITHEHIDHIAGLGVMSRKYNIPVYATRETIEAIKEYNKLGKVEYDIFHPIAADVEWKLKDLNINAFRISHDAANPVAYTVSDGNKKCAVATDMGTYSDYIVESLKGVNGLVLEANHDVRMLQVGPYPYQLKRRILSDFGHLSNESAGRLLAKIVHDNVTKVYLGHLSKENNMPELAFETVRLELDMAENEYKAKDFDISVAKRDCLTSIINV